MKKSLEESFVNKIRKKPLLFELYVLLIRIRNGMSRRDFREKVKEYERLNKSDIFHIDKNEIYPRLFDRNADAGKIDGHYFLQDIWFAQKVVENHPVVHYDIGSRVEGFISHLLSRGQNVTQLDIRPLGVKVERLDFIQTDATDLKGIKDESIESLSSLHAVEHFGLGRYGDTIDPDAWRKALRAMASKLIKGGHLYLSVPIGKKEKVCFNAHRIFAPETICRTLSDLELISFAYIHNSNIILAKIDEIVPDMLGDYDCGMFIFRKPLS